MTKVTCPEPGSQMTTGSVTAPMTEPTPRTELDDLPLDLDHYPADAQEGWEMICRAKRSLVRQSALLREIHAALGWRQKNMKERIERELEQAQNERKET